MAIVTVQIDAERAAAAMNTFAQAGFYSLMNLLGSLVTVQTKRRIRSEKTSPDGVPWKPLSPLTVAARRKGSSSPLEDTGRLLGSISHTATPYQAVIGTSVPYAPFHQYGVASIKPKKGKALAIPMAGGGYAFARETSIPARPFMGISTQNMVEIRRAVNAWVERAI